MRSFRPAAAALLLTLACGTPEPDEAPASAPDIPPRVERPNVVLLTLDTTRADHLGAWGWPHATTPNLDGLAARGTRFERCDTVAPITLPSHASLLTGLLPPRHGVRDNGAFQLGPEPAVLAEAFAAAGYRTAAVVSATVLARHYGLARGFEVYDDDLGATSHALAETAERSAGDTTDAALSALEDLSSPFFLWVHYFDPHERYAPPERVSADASGPTPDYDAEIAYMDREIGRLLAALPSQTVTVAVGDHGEMLGDHGEDTHGLLLRQGSRRVPLLMAGPGIPRGHTVSCLARTIDVPLTLLDLAGLTPFPETDGESLAELFTQPCPNPERLSYSETFLPLYSYRWHPLRALSDGETLYVRAAAGRLYDLDEDPEEANDLAADRQAEAREWEERLRALLASMGEMPEEAASPNRDLDAAERARLESLGYLGGGGTSADQNLANLPDPATRTGVARRLHGSARAVQDGRCGVVLREAPRSDPGRARAASGSQPRGPLSPGVREVPIRPRRVRDRLRAQPG